MSGNDITERILKLLSKHDYGLTIEEIANSLDINRMTASKYLAIMEAIGSIVVREVGKAKLHYLRNKNRRGWMKLNSMKSSYGMNNSGTIALFLLFFMTIIITISITTADYNTSFQKGPFQITYTIDPVDGIIVIDLDGPPLTSFNLTLYNPKNRSISPGNTPETDKYGKYRMLIAGLMDGNYTLNLTFNRSYYLSRLNIPSFDMDREQRREFVEYVISNLTNITGNEPSNIRRFWDTFREFSESNITRDEIINISADKRMFVERWLNLTNTTINRSFFENMSINITELIRDILNKMINRFFLEHYLNITNATETNQSLPMVFVESVKELSPEKENFNANDDPTFSLTSKTIFSQGASVIEEFPSLDTIQVSVYGPDKEKTNIEANVTQIASGEFEIELSGERAFRPGLYRLEIFTSDGEEIGQAEFLWGVLAINTYKSVYLLNEEAFIGIAVLDNHGRMVCDADVKLDITDPNGGLWTLKTSDGTIKVSEECEIYGVTNLPDYYTKFHVSGPGTYTINLTATTRDGTRSMTDMFKVIDAVDFDVERSGPTRIYPPVKYKMAFTILANKDYSGTVREYVPSNFEITSQSGLATTSLGDTKILAWNSTFSSGQTYVLDYEFDAPDVSPYLFTLGPLEIGEWKETREWMIASDAPWENESFDRCMNITILNAGSTNLTNFPAYINLTYDNDMQPNFIDIRFYNTSCNMGGEELDYEIENYTTGGRADIWVRIPSLPSTGTNISIYYKNNTAVGSGENATGVWDSNYSTVWHLKESSEPYNDSTSNDRDSTGGTYPAQTEGKIAQAQDFDYNNAEVITMGTFDPSSGPITLEAWIKIRNGNSYVFSWVSKCMALMEGTCRWFVDWDTAGQVYFGNCSGYVQWDDNVINDTNWHYVVVTQNDTNSLYYRDGEQTGSLQNKIVFDSGSTSVFVNIGGAPAMSADYFDGAIDEVRISNMSRSADWINQSYQMIVNQSDYVIFGDEEEQTPSGNTIIDSCQNLTSPNEIYELNQSITSDSGVCLNITADNVIIDGNGYNVTYAIYGTGTAIYTNGNVNITIRNLQFDQTNTTRVDSYAIHLENSYGNNITNSSFDIYGEDSPDGNDYVIYFVNTTNSSINGNNIIVENGCDYCHGINLVSGSNNITIKKNIFDMKGGYYASAILSDTCNHHTIYNNTITQKSNYIGAIRLYNSDNCTIDQAIIDVSPSSWAHSIDLDYYSDYNTINNTAITTTSYNTLYINNNAKNNSIINTNITATGSSGYRPLYIFTSCDGTYMDNVNVQCDYECLYVDASNNGQLHNSNLTQTSTTAAKAVIRLHGSGWTMNNTRITAIGNSGEGIEFRQVCDNTNIINSQIKTYGSVTNSYGIVSICNTGSTVNFIDSTVDAVNNIDVLISQQGAIYNFTNTTFLDKSWGTGATGTINVRWYLDVYVNDTQGNDVYKANVTAYDKKRVQIFKEETNSAGQIARQTLLEYSQDNDETNYKTPHTLNVIGTGYYEKNKTFDINGNKNIYITLTNTSLPNVQIISPENGRIYANLTVLINITNSSNTDSVLYVWNYTNYTYTQPVYFDFKTEGLHNITAYANNTNGTSSDHIEFTIFLGPVNLTECQDLNSPNIVYQLNKSITSQSGICFDIRADNVTLDGKGFSLGYAASGDGKAIYSGGYENITIMNLKINQTNTKTGNSPAIHIEDSTGNNITNNTFDIYGFGTSYYSRSYAVYFINTTNSTITRNDITTRSDCEYCYDVYLLSNSHNTTIGHNLIYTYGQYSTGIYSDTSNNQTVYNNTIDVNNGQAYPIHLYQSNSCVINHTAIDSSGDARGIFLEYSDNNVITNMNIATSSTDAIDLDLGSEYNNITNTNITSTSYRALYIHTNSNGAYIDNVIVKCAYHCIYSDTASNWKINNANITGTTAANGVIWTVSSSWAMNNSRITCTGSTGGLGIHFRQGSGNINITNTHTKTYGSGTSSEGIYSISTGPNPISFKDSTINSINDHDIAFSSGSTPFNFTNTTFSDKTWSSSTSRISVHWYLDVYVNYTNGSAMSNANVTAWNNQSEQVFSEFTEASGKIPQQVLLEYWQNATQIKYYTNYTVSASKPGYSSNLTEVNLTTNKVVYITLAPAYFIKDLPSNTVFVLDTNTNINVNQTGQFGIKDVIVGLNTSSENYTSIITFNFSQDISVSGLVTNRTQTKSLIHNTSSITGTVSRSLLIPRTNGLGRVYICPNAETIEQINLSCPGKVEIKSGEEIDGMAVSETSYDGENYYKVTNIAGSGGEEGWTNWTNPSFDRCMNITILNAGSTNLTNFPAYINLTYDNDMQPNFIDIRFYDQPCGDGGNLMDYEIENYTTSGRAHVWTRIPWLPPFGKTISIYYKNNTAVGSGENPAGVWDSNYQGVWHMTEINATDSTSNNNQGNQSGGVTFNSSGKIDGADDFDGTNAYVNFGDKSAFKITGNITVSAWVKHYNTSTWQAYVSKWSDAITNLSYIMELMGGTQEVIFDLSPDGTAGSMVWATSATTLQPDTWYYIVGVYNGSDIRIYIDGSLDQNGAQNPKSYSSGIYNGTADFEIGAQTGTAEPMNGSIDEVRISNMARTADWINQSYRIVANQSDYVIFGSEGSRKTTLIGYCAQLDSANTTYELNQSVNSTGTCFNITANNVTLDCQGYTINYSQTSPGHGVNSTNVNFTTIKNCKITGSTPSISYSEGILFNSSYFGLIDNNTIIPTAAGGWTNDGIIFYLSNNNTIKNNNITVTTDYSAGVTLAYTEYGLSDYNNITNNTITGTGNSWGIRPCSYYSTLSYNTISTEGSAIAGGCGTPLYLNDNTQKGKPIYYQYNNDSITIENDSNIGELILTYCDNVIVSNLSFSIDGILIYGGSNITIENSTIAPSGNYITGIYLEYGTNNNIIRNNNITTNNSDGIEFGNTLNNSVINSRITLTGTGASAISFTGYAENNNITGCIINTTNNDSDDIYGIGIYEGWAAVNNTRITDTTITTTRGHDIYVDNNYMHYLTNVSFDNNISFNSGATGTIHVYWYLDVHVNDINGTGLNNANVTGWNIYDAQVFTTSTNSSGWITRQTLQEYWQNATTKYYYTNYTVNASKSGYKPNSTEINLTTNKEVNIILQEYVEVTLNTPANQNNSVSLTGNITFNCSATTLDGLANITLYTNLNSTSGWQAYETHNLSGTSNSTNLIVDAKSLIGSKTFKDSSFVWNCLVYDINSNSAWAESNYTFSGWDLGTYNKSSLNITDSFIGLTENDTEQELPDNQSNDGWINMTGNVLLLHMNENAGDGNYVNDASGNGNNGTAHFDGSGTCAGITGKLNNGCFFDGTNNYISVPHDSELETGGNFSVEFWFRKKNSDDVYQSLIYKNVPQDGDGPGWTITIRETSPNIEFNIGNGTGASSRLEAYTPNVYDTEWHHVVAVRQQGATLKIYKDGFLQGESSSVDNCGQINNTEPIRIAYQWAGINVGGPNTHGFFNGTIDEVAIYNHSLSATEIKNHYYRQKGKYIDRGFYESRIFNATFVASWKNVTWDEPIPQGEELPNYQDTGSGLNMTGNVLLFHFNNVSKYGESNTHIYDFSGNGNNATCSGGSCPKWNTSGRFGGAYYFESNDYMTVQNSNSLNITDAITVSVWIRQPYFSDWQTILDKDYDTSVWFGTVASGGIAIDFDSPRSISASRVLEANEWQHIVFTYDKDGGSNNMKIYVNGDVVANKTETGSAAGNSNTLNIGRTSGGGDYFNGTIEELAIWNRSLGADEIMNIYKRGLRLNISARSCSDDSCSGKGWTGFGTNSTLTDISSLPGNQYFQYRLEFDSNNPDYTPELNTTSVTIGYEEQPCTVDFNMTITLQNGIQFGVQDPNTNVSAEGNGFYNVTDLSAPACGTVNVSVRATSDLLNGSYSIGIGNVTVNSTSSGSQTIRLSTSYQLIRSGVPAGQNNTTLLYFWLSVPPGQDSRYYNTTIEIKEERE